MDPILLDFPSEIKTRRLILRMPKPGDGQVINEAICHSINDLRPWMAFAKDIPTVEESEKNVREACAKFILREALRFHIFHKEGGQFIGSAGLSHPHWDLPKFMIGYWLNSYEKGQGYMTEAVQGLTDFAFHHVGAKRLEMLIAVDNRKSQKVAERAGYTLEGVLKNEDRLMDGRLADSYLYAKTPDKMERTHYGVPDENK
ncbi:GNAT family N-acetyltransferase [Tuberibacillus sp. Marseille-P3662]|uniref:GNAT family N-acetyltransferase n=1 Tax=Tuberibacillus sp. Marseille-P3662 TaxID=1965358 RepID=UPI000A1CCF4B|nr:GNAT family N-acetyltransferase [Tuberibacillus sp. Marseille-P3662]